MTSDVLRMAANHRVQLIRKLQENHGLQEGSLVNLGETCLRIIRVCYVLKSHRTEYVLEDLPIGHSPVLDGDQLRLDELNALGIEGWKYDCNDSSTTAYFQKLSENGDAYTIDSTS